MKYIKLFAITFLFIAALSAGRLLPLKAQYDNKPSNRSMFVDKKIKKVGMGTYYDNLDASVTRFKTGDQVEFTIKVANNGQTELDHIVVTDFLPNNLEVILNDGTYSNTDKTIIWKTDVLLPTQEKNYFVRAKIINEANGGIYTNVVKGSSDSVGDQDTASYFVGTGSAVAIKSVIPKTGSADLLIQTFVALSMVGGALGIRKYARGY